MEEVYLIDEATLGAFVDKIIEQKIPNALPEEKERVRRQGIKDLDAEIGRTIFGSLTKQQLEEYNALLDQDAGQETFRTFFQNSGVDLESKIAEAANNFQANFLGGQNV